MKLKLSELSNLSTEEYMAKVAELSRATQRPVTDEDIAWEERQIATFERKYAMTSEEMKRKVFEEEIDETVDIGLWLMVLHERDRLLLIKAKQ